MMYALNLPLSAPACCWVPFQLSKRCFSNSLSQHQSNSQAELSKPTTEDFKIKKRKRTRSLSEYIPYINLAYNAMSVYLHLVTRPVTKGRAFPPGKAFSALEKMSWIYCMHNHCFRTCYRCKIWVSENFSLPPWFPKLVTVALWLLSVMPLSSVFSQQNFSGLTSNCSRRY